MRRLKCLVLLLVCGTAGSRAWGQEKSNAWVPPKPPSPNAAALAKYGEIPVSHYTGIPNISLPIYTIESAKLKLPISLNYHAGGIRVEESASWVGLGWSLNAGGVVTRVIRGRPDFYDDDKRPYYDIRDVVDPLKSPDDLYLHGVATAPSVNAHYKERYNAEADLYYYNFGEYSGSFFIDEEGVVRQIPVTNTRIEYTVLPDTQRSEINNIATFIVTTPDGVIHRFGESEESREGTNNISKERNGDIVNPRKPDGPERFSPIVAIVGWYLTSISSSDQVEKITFEYVRANTPIMYIGSNTMRNAKINRYYSEILAGNKVIQRYSGDINYCPEELGAMTSWNINTQAVFGSRLKQITFPGGVIVFVPSSFVRCDVRESRALSRIEVRANTRSEIEPTSSYLIAYNFEYSYFSSTGSGSASTEGTCIEGIGDLNSPGGHDYTKRLKLDRVVMVGSAPGVTAAFGFTYHPVKLPSRFSFAMDEWGYYNGKNGNRTLPGGFEVYIDNPNHPYDPCLVNNNCDPNKLYSWDVVPENRNEPGYLFTVSSGSSNWADRRVDSNFTQAGMLTQITYPTGGTTFFEYENNRFSVVGTTTINTNELGGGLRIKSVVSSPSADRHDPRAIVRRYTYTGDDGLSSGHISVRPQMLSYLTTISFDKLDNGIQFYKACSNLVVHGNSIVPLSKSRGSYVGYGKVTIDIGVNGGGGRVIEYYSNPPDQQEDGSVFGDVWDITIDNTDYSWKRGWLLKAETYAKTGTGYALRQRVTNTYSSSDVSDLDNYASIRGIKPRYMTTTNSLSPGQSVTERYYYGYYRTVSGWYYVASTREENYSQVEGGAPLVTTRNYVYSPRHLQMTEASSALADGTKEYTTYRYPPDYTDGSFDLSDNYVVALQSLAERNMISQPVLVASGDLGASSQKLNVTSAFLNLYKLHPTSSGSFPNLYQALNLELADPATSINLVGSRNRDPLNLANGEKFEYDSRFIPLFEILSYNSENLVSEYQDHDGVRTAIQYEPERHQVSALLTNGNSADFTYLSEGYLTSGNPLYTSPINDIAYAGEGSFYLGDAAITRNVGAGEKIIRFYSGLFGPQVSATAGTLRKLFTHEVADSWYFHEYLLISSSPTTIKIDSPGEITYVDELQVIPRQSKVSVFNYKPLSGLSATSGDTGSVTFYEYDPLARLMGVFDSFRNAVSLYKYNYKHR